MRSGGRSARAPSGWIAAALLTSAINSRRLTILSRSLTNQKKLSTYRRCAGPAVLPSAVLCSENWLLRFLQRRADVRFAPEAAVCTKNLKSDHSGDEVRPGWRLNE